MDWVLVVFIYAGILAKGDSVALQAIPGWQSEATCKAAGAAMAPLVSSTAKDVRYVCVKR